jgi:MoaA/NifB/PqqE/SkfB family radical SAM enzyme
MGQNPTTAPYAVDLNVIGRCNLRCPFCWGPPHDQGAILDADQWKGIIYKLAVRGTRALIFTGGEPLLRPDLPEISRYAKEQRLRVTLSTNGILLPTLGRRVLPYVDEIGIPLDGASRVTNNALRRSPGKLNHFSSVAPAVRIVQLQCPQIEITIRTVVSKQNAADVIQIGQLLRQFAIERVRWKLYQFVPLGYGAEVKDDFWITATDFRTVVEQIRFTYPELQIDTLDHEARGGRYLHILPNGDTMTPTCTHEENYLGNVLDDLDGALANLAGIINHNQRHGRAQVLVQPG